MVRHPVVVIASCLAVAAAGPAAGHETDQHTVPAGKQFADIGDFVTGIYYDGIAAGVRAANEKIRWAVDVRRGPDFVTRLRSPEAVTDAVYKEYAAALFMIEGVERHVHKNPRTMLRHPGRIPGYWESIHNMFTGVYFPLDPRQLFRIWHSCTMQAYGVHFGPDKLGHFTDMGYVYYTIWRDATAGGAGEAEAHAAVMAEGKRGLILGEEGMLGYLSAGVYSNADLAANYAGMKFYLNLTQPVSVAGEVRPPMLEWDGQAWRVSPHVRHDSDFFSPFVSDHWNEALNPGLFVPGMREKVRENVRRRSERLLDFYRDEHGSRRPRSWFVKRQQELSAWYGEDYGHQGTPDEIVTIGNTCFEAPEGDDPEGRNRNGYTRLHWAAVAGDGAAIDGALAGGADVDEPVQSLAESSTEWGSTALHLAAAEGRDDVVRLLLDRGADVGRRNLREVTPLHAGVAHPPVVRRLLQRGAEPGAADERGRTALHWAARAANPASVELLLASGADPTARDHRGETPLHAAARAGATPVMQALVAAGADVDATAGFRTTPLHFAVRQGEPAPIELLVEHGADLDARDEFGVTPLHDAARLGRLRLVETMVAAGADPDAEDHYGSSPLHVAVRGGHDAVTAVLLRSGCAVNRPNGFFSYPLHEAVFAGRVATINLLLQHGADTTSRDADGRSPIEVASANGQSLVVLRIGAAEASKEERDAGGRTMGLN